MGEPGGVELEVEADAEQAAEVFGALDVAAHPVEVFGDPAEHLRTSPPGRVGASAAAVEDPRVLGPPALRAVDHEAPLGQRDAGQAAGQDGDVVAVEDERAEVDMSPFEPAVDEGRVLAQADRRLRDVAPRVRLDLPRELLALRRRRSRADQHPVAPRRVDGLDDQGRQVRQDVLLLRGDRRAEGLDVRQQWVLAQVVADDVGDVGIDPLVVGHPGADRIGQRDVPRAVGADQARDAELAVGSERQGVEEVVVHPAVDHVHPLQAAGRPHEDLAAVEHQVAPLDQLDPHLAGEEAVLVVRRVVHPGREHDDGRIVAARRGDLPEHRPEVRRVILDRPHVVLLEQEREDVLHHLPILEHVAHPRGGAAVVLENEELAVGVADQVDPRDVDVNVLRYRQADKLAAVARGPQDQLDRDHPVLEDLTLVVDVVQEQVQRADPLLEPPLQPVPLVAGDQPRDRIEGDDLLHPLVATVDRERDPLMPHRQVGHLVTALQLRGPERVEAVAERRVVRPWPAVGDKHLIERHRVVASEEPHAGCGIRHQHGRPVFKGVSPGRGFRKGNPAFPNQRNASVQTAHDPARRHPRAAGPSVSYASLTPRIHAYP